MGMLLGYFKKKEPPLTPISGGSRCKNIAVNNFRGLLGPIVPLILMFVFLKKGEHDKTTTWIWLWMIWSFLIQPVNIPVTGLIPVFTFPMFCAMTTDMVCSCYFNENIALFILGGWLMLLLNNSGFDRRLTLCLLCGSSDRCSSAQLLIRSSVAAFILSMVSNRLIVTANLIQYVAPTLISLKTPVKSSLPEKVKPLLPEPVQTLLPAEKKVPDANFDELRYVIINAIHTSSAIGGIVIPHASFGTLAFRCVFYGSAPKNTEFADVFNYIQYTAFAFPTAVAMFIMNLIYNLIMLGKPMNESSQIILKTALDKYRNALPKQITLHEVLTIIAELLTFGIYYSRWSSWFDGWGADWAAATNPRIKDATVAAIFIVLLSIIPCSFRFLKYCSAKTQSQLPPLKPESGIMWWKFVDKNTVYGYIFVIGSGVCLSRGFQHTGLDIHVQNHVGTIFTDQSHNIMMFMIVSAIVILVNMMSGVAALSIFLPFVMNMIKMTSPHYRKMHYGPLGVGIGTSLGFMWPFLYTPAYFAHYVGKVPKLKMAKAGLPSALICGIILWVALCFYADFVIDNTIGIVVMKYDIIKTTTTAVNTTEALNVTLITTELPALMF